jgi:chloramphenicol-sensitive protein RarD
MNHRKHYAAAITAFAIWGFFPILLRALQNYSSGEILYFRILFSSVILLVIILGFKKDEIKANLAFLRTFPKQKIYSILGLTLLGGALLTVNWLTFIYIVNNINVKTASFSYLICPVMTAVLGYLLLKEKMTLLQWIAVGLCAVSCMLMGISSARELGYSVLTALTYAFYLISQRKNQGFDRMIILGIQVLFAFLILNILYSSLITKVPTAMDFYSMILIMAIVFTVFPLFLNLFALNKINSATIGILMYINPLINFTVAFVVYHESVSTLQIVGYSIIFIGLILFNYPNFRRIVGSV